VPAETTVKLPESFGKKKKNNNIRPKLKDLVIKDNHGFDKKMKAILCPVTKKEYNDRKKKYVVFTLMNIIILIRFFFQFKGNNVPVI